MSDQQQRPQSSQLRFTDYLTVGAAAEVLGVSPWTLRNWDRSGKLKPHRHPKNRYRIYRREDLEAVLRLDGAATPSGWRTAACGGAEHVVQFYESDEYLVESVAAYVSPVVAADTAAGAAVVIATAKHLRAIGLALARRGIDVPRAAASGRYVALDASETLARFMGADGSPDPQRFADVIGTAVVQAAQRFGRLRAFGEMVALLWAAGNPRAAVRLEAMWNALAGAHPFSLLCGYPMSAFRDDPDGASLADVCACHGRVVPAESYAALPDDDARARAVVMLQQKALSFEAETARRRHTGTP